MRDYVGSETIGSRRSGNGTPRRLLSLRARIVAALVLAGLGIGWLTQGQLGIDPNYGTGYWLGICGTAMMVLLLGYPLRKRQGASIPGSVGFWFRLHMLLGLFGPLVILYHANFRWSALNSGIALWAMLLVAISGLIGRYIHIHIYSGFSLRHREADEIIGELRRQRDRLDHDGDLGQEVEERLEFFRQVALRSRNRLSRAVFTSLHLWIGVAREKRGLANQAAHEVALHLEESGAGAMQVEAAEIAVRRHVKQYLETLVDAGSFSTYERLFALWHLAHIPLYIFLGIAATIHVLAVHYY